MAIGDPYATTTELAARLGRSDDGTFAALLDAASRSVELFTRRQFNKETAATARTFRALDSRVVYVADFYTVTDLVVETDENLDGTFEKVWTAADFQLEPVGGIVADVPGWPFWRIRAVEDLFFPACTFRTTVRVTARWGWTAVPAGVKESTLDVAVVMSSGVGGQASGPVRAEAIDGYSVSYQTMMMSSPGVPPEMVKAAPYRRKFYGLG